MNRLRRPWHRRRPPNARPMWPTPVRRRDDPPEPSWISADTPAGPWVRSLGTTSTTWNGCSVPLWGGGCAPRSRCSWLRAAGPVPGVRPPADPGAGNAEGRRVAGHAGPPELRRLGTKNDVGVGISVGLAVLEPNETLVKLTARVDAALLDAGKRRGE